MKIPTHLIGTPHPITPIAALHSEVPIPAKGGENTQENRPRALRASPPRTPLLYLLGSRMGICCREVPKGLARCKVIFCETACSSSFQSRPHKCDC